MSMHTVKSLMNQFTSPEVVLQNVSNALRQIAPDFVKEERQYYESIGVLKRKAEILCDASGAKLGNLIAIDYNWGELDIYSHTRFDCCEEAMAPMKACSIDIDPEDIDVSDTATFVWELV